MYHIIEKNERRNRQSAFWLAVTLHLALGVFIYFQASNTKPAPRTEITKTVTKTSPVQSRPVIKP